MNAKKLLRGAQLAIACAAVSALNTQPAQAKGEVVDGQVKVSQRFVNMYPGNPYLPLWEHVPDGEPKVFEDPDRPGHYRAYIIGSHDVRFGSYCGPDIRMWSAPIENLNAWRDEGPIFTFQAANGSWDVMYAPDIAEVIEKDAKGKEKKVYYLYPHSRGPRREAMVCKGDRPDGPFTPLNLDENQAAIAGSCVGFDPSVFIEKVTDKNDPDYAKGFRAYCYWGFQHSTAGQLDQNTMYSVREPRSENLIDPFLPVGNGQQRGRRPGQQDAAPVEVKYAIAEGQKASDFNFFEASSIRQVGNKYVMIFSGHSGTEYGLGSTNSALRYCYADSPLGPWYSGGVAVDSRGVTLNKDGSGLMTSNFAHNTHGSIEKIGDQWYIFYHRPARGFGNARQSMVAPITITADEKPCSEGGKVVLHGYDPYAPDGIWEAKATNGDYYGGAEVTSEGFNIYGLPPYAYYSAGYACFFTNNNALQDTWDVWSNEMIANVNAGDIIGYKYFGLGGLKKDSKGIEAFDGTTSKQHSSFNIWFKRSSTEGGINIKVMMDGPWKNEPWNGKEIGKFKIPAGTQADKVEKYTIDVSEFVDDIEGKHAIYLVFDAAVDGAIGEFYGCGFNTKVQSLKRPVPPTLNVKIGGKAIELPTTPIRSTEQNGIVNNNHYEMDYKLEPGQKSKVTVECLWSTMQFWVDQIKGDEGTAVITAEYLYPGTNNKQTKEYKIHISK